MDSRGLSRTDPRVPSALTLSGAPAWKEPGLLVGAGGEREGSSGMWVDRAAACKTDEPPASSTVGCSLLPHTFTLADLLVALVI